MIPAAELSRALAELLARGQVDVYDDGRLLPDLVSPSFEVTEQGAGLLLHLWSDQKNLVRRVLDFREESAGELQMEVQRFGRLKPGRLELRVRAHAMAVGRLTRQKFLARFRQLLAEQFPDEEVASLTTAADLEHSFSSCYPRGVMQQGRRAWAVLGVAEGESAATIVGALTFGLLWLDWTREHAARRVVEGLRLFLPAGSLAVTSHRLQALAPGVTVELYETDAQRMRIRKADPSDSGNLASRLMPRRECDQLLASAAAPAAALRALVPEAAPFVDAVVVPGAREVAFRFRGLEFARWRKGVLFAIRADGRMEPSAADAAPLRKRLEQICAHRRAGASGNSHPLYRAQGERWLESLILADPARVEPRLDPRFVYPQVPAFASSDRAVLDLLGATRDGRLVVIELKVSENIQLVFQALDYWLRVRHHQREGDFESLGYFAGLPLQQKAPLLYLVAPGFRFHDSADILLRYLSPELELARVGLNENWREGVQVVFRK
jgi:hypothetical protein